MGSITNHFFIIIAPGKPLPGALLVLQGIFTGCETPLQKYYTVNTSVMGSHTFFSFSQEKLVVYWEQRSHGLDKSLSS